MKFIYSLLLASSLLLFSCNPMRHLEGARVLYHGAPPIDMMMVVPPNDPEAADPMRYASYIEAQLQNELNALELSNQKSEELKDDINVEASNVFTLIISTMLIEQRMAEGVDPLDPNNALPLSMRLDGTLLSYGKDNEFKEYKISTKTDLGMEEQQNYIRKNPTTDMTRVLIDKAINNFVEEAKKQMIKHARKN